jgi:DNA protecting protein DprA
MTAHTENPNKSEFPTEEKGIDSPMDNQSLSGTSLFKDDEAPSPVNTAFDFTLLALGSIKGLGRKGLAALVDVFKGDLGKVWKAPTQRVQQALLEAKVPASDQILSTIQNEQEILLERAGEQLVTLQSKGVHIISFKKLPKSLKSIPDPPRWLFVQGDPEVLYHRPAVAVVGTRKPTERGKSAAGYVARLLAPYPITLVSGLAEGIDEVAHRESLAEGVKNVAFLGHGINFVFPASTGDLRKLIVDRGGAVATEYLPNDHYQKAYFVERNRLQAALASIVIPVEANPRGGTAHTIRFARKYNRQVVGIKWRGANGILEDLEREGTTIIEITNPAGSKQLDQIFRSLARASRHKTYGLATLERRVLREIQFRAIPPSDIDHLIRTLKKAKKDF